MPIRIRTLHTTVDGDEAVQIVAWCSGVVGYGTILHAGTDDDTHPVLCDVYVREEWRRKGIGRGITKVALAWADDHPHPLYLHVRPDNEAARALYDDLGFTCEGGTTDDGSLWMKAPTS